MRSWFRKNLAVGIWLVVAILTGCVTAENGTEASAGGVNIDTKNAKYASYFSQVRHAIEPKWSYPKDAAKAGHEGAVELEFRIARNGDVDGLKVLKSSGHQELDDAIVSAVKAASPFEPLPADWKKERMVVTGTFK